MSEERCPLARFLGAVGDRWSLMLIRQAFLGETRYEQFRSSLDLSPTVLSRRLDHLCDQGIFERVVDEARPKRPEYRLTQKGLGLWQVVLAAVDWGETFVSSRRKSEWMIEHTECGNEFQAEVELSCTECSEPVSLADLRARPRRRARAARRAHQ